MTTKPYVRAWLLARAVIKQALVEITHADDATSERNAEAILARLAGHEPPLLVCTPDEVKEDDHA